MRRYSWYHALTLALLLPFITAGFLWHFTVLGFLAGRSLAQDIFKFMDDKAP